ncbi:MAG: hypothetical protein CFE45_07420 [Burkholderiales bacterium PBB5]|nr:MAG: hypothetical protein CFE45_07420 [Burkholderiales bacterium PBB5]
MAGLPDFVRAAARQAAAERGLAVPVITLSRSLVVPFLSHSTRRDLRELAWRAWVGRGEQPGARDNRPIACRILAVRQRQAALMGHASYADFKLTDTMAQTRERVWALLDDVWARAVPAMARERALLHEAMAAAGEGTALQPWDWRYWAEQVRQARYALDDAALKPYNYNLGPFLANPKAIQQGYSVAEPIYVENQGKFKPVVHLLADHGFSTYSTVIEARTETVKAKPELVQRFVDASIIGWVNYLYGNRSAANALMLKENPEMTAAEIEASVALMKAQGIVDSGEAKASGIGAMSNARIQDFYAQMVKAGLYKAGDVDLAQVATLQFVNKKVGQELKAKLGAK